MRYLSSALRDRIRSLGVDGDLPMVPVFRSPDNGLDHLHPECLGMEMREPSLVMVPFLDSRIDTDCGQCLESPSWGAAMALADDVIGLDNVLSQVRDLEDVVEKNDPMNGRLRPEVLGNALSECDLLLTAELTSFGREHWWEYVSNAGPVLVSRVEAVRSKAVELLRSPVGVKLTQEALRFERMALPSSARALFVERDHLSAIHLAALYAFGRELVPGRFVVEGSTLAVGALERVAHCGAVRLAGHSEDVIATALALWELEGSGPMATASAALQAASIILSTSSNA